MMPILKLSTKNKIMKFININNVKLQTTCTNTIMASYQIMLMKHSQPIIPTTHTTQDMVTN